MSPAPRKGPISQRALLPLLRTVVDDAMAPNSTAHKDVARARLRELLETANCSTPYIWNSLSTRRNRFIAGMGYAVPSRYLMDEWHGKVEPPEAEDD